MFGAHELVDAEFVGQGRAGQGPAVDAVGRIVLRHDEVGFGGVAGLEVSGQLLIFPGEPADALLSCGDRGAGGLAGLLFFRFARGFGGLLGLHPLQFLLGLLSGLAGFSSGTFRRGDPLFSGHQLRFRLRLFQRGGLLLLGPLVDLAQRFRDEVRDVVFLRGRLVRRRGGEVETRKVAEAESGVLRMVSGEDGLFILFGGPVRDGGRSRHRGGNGADDGTEL